MVTNTRLSIAALAMALSSCAVDGLYGIEPTRPVAPGDLFLGGPAPAVEITLRLKSVCTVPSEPGWSYVLAPGDYRPTDVDLNSHGVYFSSPSDISYRGPNVAQGMKGGIHVPGSSQGRMSMWVSVYYQDLRRVVLEKKPLPDDCWQPPYTKYIGLLRNGEELHTQP